MIDTDLIREECAEAGRIYFPAGLPGFQHLHSFELLPLGSHDCAFSALVSCDDPSVRFVVVSPWEFRPDFELELDPSVSSLLGVVDTADALVLCVVTPGKSGGDTTINLLGPIVVNRRTLEARQTVQPGPRSRVREPLGGAS